MDLQLKDCLIDRLNGFALLYVHRDLIINFEYVIDEFLCKNRRLNFN